MTERTHVSRLELLRCHKKRLLKRRLLHWFQFWPPSGATFQKCCYRHHHHQNKDVWRRGCAPSYNNCCVELLWEFHWSFCHKGFHIWRLGKVLKIYQSCKWSLSSGNKSHWYNPALKMVFRYYPEPWNFQKVLGRVRVVKKDSGRVG